MHWAIVEAARRQTAGDARPMADIAAVIIAEAEAATAVLFPPAPPPAPGDVIGTRVEPGRVVELLANGTERVVEP